MAGLFFAVALGCLLVWRFGGLRGGGPRWATALLVFGSGAAAGMGLVSVVFFLSPALAPWIELAVFAALAWEVWRTRGTRPAAEPARGFPLNGYMMAALALAAVLIAWAAYGAWTGNLDG